jgi:hypothetical protein
MLIPEQNKKELFQKRRLLFREMAEKIAIVIAFTAVRV